jgi:hypothetical protein
MTTCFGLQWIIIRESNQSNTAHISSLSTAILALGKTRSRRESNLGCRGADRPGWCDILPESPHESCRMGRRIDADSLICSLGNCECDVHTAHHLLQRRLTADWGAPRESLHGCAVRSPLAAKLHQGHATGSLDIQNGWTLSGQASQNHINQLCTQLTGCERVRWLNLRHIFVEWFHKCARSWYTVSGKQPTYLTLAQFVKYEGCFQHRKQEKKCLR